LRFAAEHGFTIEDETSEEIFRQKDSLLALSVERIWKEFSRLICGAYCAPILRRYFDVFTVFLPEIAPMKDFEQHNPHHIYDVWEHTLVAMTYTPPEVVLRTAVFFHDIGKPPCFEIGEDGIGHFRGHPKVSAAMADTILQRLKVDTDTRETVVLLVKAHDVPLDPVFKNVRRRLAQYGEEKVRLLLEVKRADIAAHSMKSAYRLKELSKFEVLLDQAIEEQMCFSFSAMVVNGKDLIGIGIPAGTRLGSIKKQLLNEIIDGALPNEKEALLKRALEIWKSCQ
jgi:tRNA nucleotidyltransferase (CCA-adding enzyme)